MLNAAIRTIVPATPVKANTDKVHCRRCGSHYHYTAFCHAKPKKPLQRSLKPLAREASATKRKRIQTFNKWIKANPADENGHWLCYLQISALCPQTLTRQLLTLEHVEAKSRRPDLRFDITNIKAACPFCNKMKGSRSLAELAKIWPHLLKYL